MRKNIILGYVFIFLAVVYGIWGLSLNTYAHIPFKVSNLQSSQLTIYTYESLLADPPYDIESNYTLYSGIGEMQIIRFGDANEILTRLIAEKDDPIADVVIGIDNALIHLIENLSEVLEPYTPPNISQIDNNLIQNLDPDKYLIPYDFGIISLYYQNQIINASTNPELEDLTLETLLDSELISMLIVENPKFSSPGLGFLLWTIAVYGDPQINFNGLLNSDWRNWWREARSEITITKSWGDAFNIFIETSEGKPIMVSYGTSPAYGYCQWGDDTTSAKVTHENNDQNAWLQIEGIGLVKNAPHSENGKEFIDWFLSTELQSELPEHQWMYPANMEANVSICFEQASISPKNVSRLNDLITSEMLKNYLTEWQDQWEQVAVQRSIPGFTTSIVITSTFFMAISVTIKKKKRP
ncbi:MAG: thiamine ABC transporter substrate-binding protein [Candidatus Hodarchaeales archaeon]|jgi:thiamine transport system substrate-binding protein